MNRALLYFFCASFAFAQQYTITTLAGGTPPPTPALAVSSSIGDPPRVAADSSGNVYFASLYSIFKVDRAGTLSRIAGTGRRGLSGDGGPALSAQLQDPVAIAVDNSGNIYFADRSANIIRRIAPNGIVSTFAGSGIRGAFGDGGPALEAYFDAPTGLALDSAGNLYVADTNNNVIRKIAVNGLIDVVAGNGGAGYSGDGGAARIAHLNAPEGVALDGVGNIYIADTFNHRIRLVNPNGVITTFAANGYPGYGGDNGPAVYATLFFPTDVAVDRNGVYIADLGNSRIRKVTDGSIATLAGTNVGPQAVGVSGQQANAVRLNGPTGIAVDASGNVFFAEGSIGSGSGLTVGDYKVFKVSPQGVLTAVAGNGYKSYSGDFAPAARAQMNAPAGMAIDAAGNLYFSDSQNHRVRKITPGGMITTVAGNGVPGFSGDGGSATKAELNTPLGIALDAVGNLFIVDSANNRIRKVLPNGNIGTVAGNGNAAFFGDGSRAITAALHAPAGIAVDAGGNLYIADTLDHRVRKVDGAGIIDTIAGRGFGSTGDGGPAIQALLNLPDSVAVDGAGNVYIADTGNGRIRKVSATDRTITTVYSSDSPSHPRGLTRDFAGNIYFTDELQNRVRKIANDGAITIVAGIGTCCYSGDGGPASAAQLNAPWGAASDPAGNLYVADAGNNAVRVIYAGSSTSYIRSVVNGASDLVAGLAPGEIITVHGAGLGPAQLVQAQLNAAGFFGTQLAGATVTFNGTPGPMLYTSAGQVSAIVPYGIIGSNVQVVVQNQGVSTAAFTVPLASSSPALFTADSTGFGQVLAVNRDGSLNSPGHPAAPNTFVTLYATGEGQTAPQGVDGKPGVSPLPTPLLPVSVTIDGRGAFVQYAGGAPNIVAGLMQLNVLIPDGISNGAVPIILQVGTASSPQGVTIAVGTP